METNEQDEGIVANEEATNEEVEETTGETAEVKTEAKPKRTPQEELEYFEGRASRLRKQLGTNDSTDKPAPTERSSELDYGQLALLRTEGIKGSGEVALFKEIMAETGKGLLDVIDSGYFKSRLTEFREAQESANAVPKGKGRSGQTGVTDVDVATAKFEETGKMPEDLQTRVAIKNKLLEREKNNNMFSGPSVVGPRSQSY